MKTRQKAKEEEGLHGGPGTTKGLLQELSKGEIEEDLELLGLRRNPPDPSVSQVLCGRVGPFQVPRSNSL